MAYDLRMACESFSVPAASSADVVISTDAGWGTPDACIIYWGVDDSSDSAKTDNVSLSYGIAVSGAARCVAGYSQDRTDPTNCGRQAVNDRVGFLLNSSLTEDGSISVKSWDTDGLTLQVDSQVAAQSDGFVILIQANGVAIRDFDCETSSPDDVNDVGFEPDLIYAISCHQAWATASGGSAALHWEIMQGWGLNKETDEWVSQSHTFGDNLTDSRAVAYPNTTSTLLRTSGLTDYLELGAAIFSFDSLGFNVADDGAGDGTFGSVLCLDTNGANAEVISVEPPSGTSEFTATTTFQADYIWILGSYEVDASWNNRVTNLVAASGGIGFSDEAADVPAGDGQMYMHWILEDNEPAATCDQNLKIIKSLVVSAEPDTESQNIDFDVKTFGPTSITFDQIQVDVARSYRAVVFAEKEAAAGPGANAKAKVVPFQIETSDVGVVLDGGGSWGQPNAVAFYISADDFPTGVGRIANIRASYGYSDGTLERCVAGYISHNLSPLLAYRQHVTGRTAFVFSSDGTEDFGVTFSGWTTNGVSFNLTGAPATTMNGMAVLYQAANVAVVDVDNTAGEDVLDLGFRPSAVHCLTAGVALTEAGDGSLYTSGALMGQGWCIDTTPVEQTYYGFGTRELQTTTQHLAWFSNQWCIRDFATEPPSTLGGWSGEFTATGINFAQVDAQGVTGSALAMDFGTAGVKIGVAPTAVGNTGFSHAGVGFQPDFLWYFGGRMTAGEWEGMEVGYNAGEHGFGVSNEGVATPTDQQYSIGFNVEDGAAAGSANAEQMIRSGHILHCVAPDGSVGGTNELECDVESFDADGFTLDWKANAGTERQHGYFALEFGATGVVNYDSRTLVKHFEIGAGSDGIAINEDGWGQPNAAFLYLCSDNNITDSTLQNNPRVSYGITDGENDRCVVTYMTDSISPTAPFRQDVTGRVAVTYNSNGTEDVGLSFSGWTTNGVSFNLHESTATSVNGVCVMIQAANALVADVDNTAGTDSINAGFEPKAAYCMSAGTHLDEMGTGDLYTPGCLLSHGWALNNNPVEQVSQTWGAREDVTTTESLAIYTTQACLRDIDTSTPALAGGWSGDFTANGIDFYQVNSAGMTGAVLLLDLGDASKKIGFADTPDGNTGYIYTGAGFQPDFLWYIGSRHTSAGWDSFQEGGDAGTNGLGVATTAAAEPTDGQYSIGAIAEDNVAAGSASAAQLMRSGHTMHIIQHNGSVGGTNELRADLEQFNADGFTLDWKANAGTTRQHAYLILEHVTGAADSPPAPATAYMIRPGKRVIT